MDDQEIKKQYEAAKAHRTEERIWFLDRKTRLTYYIISLPFAVFGLAIASYPYAIGTIYLAILEIIAWVLLLLSGGAGIVAIWGEMEQSRIASMKYSAEMERYTQHGGEFTPEYAKRLLNREERLIKAENAEYRHTKLHWIFLIVGLFALLLSRSILALAAAG